MKKKDLVVLCCIAVCLVGSQRTIGEEKTNRPIWLVVTRPALVKAISPLAEHRAKEGFATVISTESVDRAVESLDGYPAFILLVGDDEPGQEDQPWYLPARRIKRYRWQSRQSKEFASDAAWTDTDGDSVPEIPIGRIPARKASQVEQIVSKIISFEQKRPSLDDLRLAAWGGAAGFDPVTDRLASVLMLQVVRTKVPGWIRPWIICSEVNSPFCGWPRDQAAMFTEQLKRGGCLAVLIGHAEVQYFYAMNFRGEDFWYGTADAAEILSSGDPGAPLVMICCLAGNFTTEKECFAESLLTMAAGPPAVIAATAESHPLTNYFSSVCLVQALDRPGQRLGEVWLNAQKQALEARDLIVESMLSDVEGKLEERIDVEKLRRDQMLMYVLLGDPALKMRLPEKLHGKIKRQETGWYWQVHRPKDATELHVGFRASEQQMPSIMGDLQRDSAKRDFQTANETLGFSCLPSPGTGENWEGVVNMEGTLRLVAIGPEKIYVAALNLTDTATRQ